MAINTEVKMYCFTISYTNFDIWRVWFGMVQSTVNWIVNNFQYFAILPYQGAKFYGLTIC